MALAGPAEQVRAISRCARCHEVRSGVTIVQRSGHSKFAAGDRSHICDGCAAGIVERPLDAVLGDYLIEADG